MASAWGDFAATVLRFPDTGLSIDLRLVLPPSAPQQLADLGLPGAFGIVTGCNPLGSRLDEASNQRLTRVLASVVRDRFPAARPVVGSSPDGRHQEPGWAIAAPLGEVERLAAEFLQAAVFWYDGERFFIFPVQGAGPREPLPAANPAR